MRTAPSARKLRPARADVFALGRRPGRFWCGGPREIPALFSGFRLCIDDSLPSHIADCFNRKFVPAAFRD
jgi:hypothetical protein